MTQREFLETVAELVEGLQVPVSLHGAQLGAAREPWEKLHSMAGLGWHSADEYVAAFKSKVTAYD